MNLTDTPTGKLLYACPALILFDQELIEINKIRRELFPIPRNVVERALKNIARSMGFDHNYDSDEWYVELKNDGKIYITVTRAPRPGYDTGYFRVEEIVFNHDLNIICKAE